MAHEASPVGSSALCRSLRCCNGGTGCPCTSKTESPPRSPPARDPSADRTSRSQTAQEDNTNSNDSANHSASQQISESQCYTQMHYAHTFHSKKEVQHFLDTEEVKGKGLVQKKLADDPSGQSSGSRRSTKRTMLLPACNDPPKIGSRRSIKRTMLLLPAKKVAPKIGPTAYADYLRRPNIGGMFQYSTRDDLPPGFL